MEHLKEEHTHDKINFEKEKSELKSKIEKYKEQCAEFLNENERLQKCLQDLESAKLSVEEEKSQINLHNTDLTNQVTKVRAMLFLPAANC